MIKIVLITCALVFGSGLKAAKLNSGPRACVIGAGMSGLTVARRLKEAGIDFVVLEFTNYVGGTWRFEERVGTDEYGLRIHTSMYKNLRTNLPKQVMEFPDFELPEGTPQFPTSNDYYKYLNSTPAHFGFEKNIKRLHQMTLVKRVENIWKVKYEHVPTRTAYEESFDYIFVSTGHYSFPHMPNIQGENIFKGRIIHSHDFREPEPYKCKRVLIIGAGSSGLELMVKVAEVTKTLFHSHHIKYDLRTPYPPNYIRKPDVKELNETGAIFVDGSYEEIDDIIYATGYEFYYPFLDESCGLTVNTKHLAPLHKILVNINQPTMFIMGVIVNGCLAIAIDAQARYAVRLIKGEFSLPSRDEMIDELQKRIDSLQQNGKPLSHLHHLYTEEDQYYADLSRESGIERVKPVMAKLFAADLNAILTNLYTFRNYVYTIVDDETFTRTTITGDVPPPNTSCVYK